MGKYSNYKLILKDLEVGKTAYNYELDNSFFKLINDEESDVKRGKFVVDVEVDHSVTAFNIAFAIKGAVRIPCDRCLDDVLMEVDTKQKLIVKFGKEYSEESDEIIIIPADEGEINIAWFIYEFIILSLPIKHVHPSGQCNKVVTQKLRQHRATTPNDQGEDDQEDDEMDNDSDDSGSGSRDSDPRWDALKDLESE